jgi:hypothetical protein
MTWVASIGVDPDTAVERQIVEGITLDEYTEREKIEKVDFVKMDVEGAEASALSGMTLILRRDKPILLIELHQYDRFGGNHPALCKLREYRYKISHVPLKVEQTQLDTGFGVSKLVAEVGKPL